jgi:hypothetical protein
LRKYSGDSQETFILFFSARPVEFRTVLPEKSISNSLIKWTNNTPYALLTILFREARAGGMGIVFTQSRIFKWFNQTN